MKKMISVFCFFLFVIAIMGNAIIFVSSMKLGEETHRFEQKIYVIQRENAELEKKMSETLSLQYAHMYKKPWGFEAMKNLVTVGELQFALYKAQ